MDWIEQIFHVNLDNGNGMVELSIFLILAAVVVALSLWVWSKKYAGRTRVQS